MSRYRLLLATASVLLFSSGLDLYWFMAGYTAVTPRDVVTMFACAVAPVLLFILYRRELFVREIGLPVLWSAAYLTVSVVWYIALPSDGATQEFRDRLFSVFFMVVAAVAFMTPEGRRAAGATAIVVLFLTIILNGVQMMAPDWFYMGVSTRGSGLFGNANQCGAALVIGMTMASPLVTSRLRLLFYLLVGGGIAMTFSRSSIAGWLLASLALIVFDSSRTRVRGVLMGVATAAFLTMALLQVASTSITSRWFSLDDNLTDRVSFFSTLDTTDDAAQERKDLAAHAWDMFLQHPLAGNGLASTVQWTERASTHNMFLSLVVDHGVLGVFIMPALLYCVLRRRPAVSAAPHVAFCLFTLWYAFFSHNILTERYFLLGFAFFAMGGIAVPADAAARAEPAAPLTSARYLTAAIATDSRQAAS
jgi:O-Antigen ligase